MSYKALLNAKAVSSMYSNSSYNTSMANEVPTYSQEDGQSAGEEEEEFANGEGSPEEGQGSGSADASNSHSFSLKRCRFAPYQDIELLREIQETDDKPYSHGGKASWSSWGKIAHALNNKQIFGPLHLSALTCKLRFEFLMKNYGGHALKYNPKRGTPDEFRRRDDLIAQVAPEVPERGGGSQSNGKKRRGRPRKRPFTPELLDEMDGPSVEEPVAEQRPARSASHQTPSKGTKRKPGRPRKIPNTPAPTAFLDGAQLVDYIQPRPRTRARNQIPREESVVNEPAQAAPVAAMTPQPMAVPQVATQPFLHYMAQPTGLPEGSVITMLAEYLKRHHESDLQFKREEMEARHRERSEERRLEREQIDVKRGEIEIKRAEVALQQQKWEMERQERLANLEMMKKKLLK